MTSLLIFRLMPLTVLSIWAWKSCCLILLNLKRAGSLRFDSFLLFYSSASISNHLGSIDRCHLRLTNLCIAKCPLHLFHILDSLHRWSDCWLLYVWLLWFAVSFLRNRQWKIAVSSSRTNMRFDDRRNFCCLDLVRSSHWLAVVVQL